MRTRLFLLLIAAAAVGCQTPAEPPKPAATAGTEPSTPPPEQRAPEGPPPGSPAARTQAQALLKQAAEHLNDGNEEAAREDISQALIFDPGNKTGACLLRGLTVDPQATLGKDATSYAVRPGETLGSIAQRALGESCEFYLLARYNQIRVPSKLYVGQVLKIPGKVALAAPGAKPPEVPPATLPPASPQPGTPQPTEAAPSAFGSSRGATDAAEVRARIERHQRAAIAAFRRQDLATSIKEWSDLLKLDPNNEMARARRQEAIELQKRLNQVK